MGKNTGFMEGNADLDTAYALIALSYCKPKAAGEPQPKTTYFSGKVMPLADLLMARGIKLDADASPHWLALATMEGKVHPLVKDDGSRMFYNDPELQRRSMRLAAVELPGSNMLKVTEVSSR